MPLQARHLSTPPPPKKIPRMRYAPGDPPPLESPHRNSRAPPVSPLPGARPGFFVPRIAQRPRTVPGRSRFCPGAACQGATVPALLGPWGETGPRFERRRPGRRRRPEVAGQGAPDLLVFFSVPCRVGMRRRARRPSSSHAGPFRCPYPHAPTSPRGRSKKFVSVSSLPRAAPGVPVRTPRRDGRASPGRGKGPRSRRPSRVRRRSGPSSAPPCCPRRP